MTSWIEYVRDVMMIRRIEYIILKIDLVNNKRKAVVHGEVIALHQVAQVLKGQSHVGDDRRTCVG